MKKEFVDYTEALALKELGFDKPCFGSYVKLTETQNTFFMNDIVSEIDRETPLHESLITKAPTYSQAFRWFREKYKLDGIAFWNYTGYMWNIIDIEKSNKITNITIQDDDMEEYVTKEKSELECLKKLIEIVKEK